jgi:hypothetical protein
VGVLRESDIGAVDVETEGAARRRSERRRIEPDDIRVVDRADDPGNGALLVEGQEERARVEPRERVDPERREADIDPSNDTSKVFPSKARTSSLAALTPPIAVPEPRVRKRT